MEIEPSRKGREEKSNMTTLREPVIHYATDRRCYNGAYCSDLQRELDSLKAVEAAIRRVEPSYRCCYFPGEGKYLSFVSTEGRFGFPVPREFGDMYVDKGQCLLAAWRELVAGASREGEEE